MLMCYCCREPILPAHHQRALGGLRVLSFFLVLLTQTICVAAQSANENPATENPSSIGFVVFDAGEYQREQSGQIGKILNQLQSFPQNTPIKLIGHSHSMTNLATSQLASIRASSVRDQLINFGVAAESISIDGDVQNFLTNGQLLHGVTVLVLPQTQFTPEAEAAVELPQPKVSEVGNAPLHHAVQTSVVKHQDIEIRSDTDVCDLVEIHVGSLHSNLVREIGHCGYIMGRWRFGSGDEVIDWDVPVAYNTRVDNGIVGLLQLIERNYQIRAHIHRLDQSIDFFPSIRDRESRGQ